MTIRRPDDFVLFLLALGIFLLLWADRRKKRKK